MARIRSIHPGIFTDEAFASVSMAARILLIGIWCEAWDDGIFEWKPLKLKMRLFPADDVDVGVLLDELAAHNCIQQFDGGGRPYGAIRNFCKFQRPKKPNSSNALPESLRSYVAFSEAVPNQYGTGEEAAPHQYGTDGEKSLQREEVGGKDRVSFASLTRAISAAPSKARKAAPAARFEEAFGRFWGSYPHRPGDPRKPAHDRFVAKVKAGADPEAIVAGAIAFARKRAGEDPKFTPQAKTWLNEERWTSETTAQPATPAELYERVDTYFVTGGWAPAWGPAPGEPGCRVPPEVIEAARRRREAADADP